MTRIESNGSRWAGQHPFPISALFARLQSDPLDRTFERYGNFANAEPVNLKGEPMCPGGVHFFGNFLTYSHVFSVMTDDADLIERLTKAIRDNQNRADYLAQPDIAEQEAAHARTWQENLRRRRL